MKTIFLTFTITILIFGFIVQVSSLQDSEDARLTEEQVDYILKHLREIRLEINKVAKDATDDARGLNPFTYLSLRKL